MMDFRTTALVSTPSYALLIGDTLQEMGIPVSALSLKYGLFRAEPWSEAVRQEIEDKLGIGATDNYGLFEIEGTEPHYQILVERKGAHVHDSRPESPRIMGRRGVKRP